MLSCTNGNCSRVAHLSSHEEINDEVNETREMMDKTLECWITIQMYIIYWISSHHRQSTSIHRIPSSSRILIGKESPHYTSALHSALAESHSSLLLEQAIQRRWARSLMRAWNMYGRWLVNWREGKSRSVSPSAWYEFTSSAAQFRITSNMRRRTW